MKLFPRYLSDHLSSLVRCTCPAWGVKKNSADDHFGQNALQHHLRQLLGSSSADDRHGNKLRRYTKDQCVWFQPRLKFHFAMSCLTI